ncbi:MAG: DMSO reductase iron-sulfur subunit [Gammaproteobacteria bacterium]|jgi:DMSO reductase iron-sulfur subunit
MWNVRDDEPQYAFLNDKETASVNYYEAPIDLIARSGGEAPLEREMFINEEPGVGCNPNRNKQHAFHFTADNCIGCHACEAACSEKNDNPPHISFRSVGYVEGGTYPNFTRMNISMACNHCDDPVCLKGCPTGAYTKHAEYGAVLQDPDTCFGCGYCTWVCPYNAPQLDPVEGQVSKCNMCVDRLEVGLKPACVTACLGNALNFGVVENTPENRDQAKVQIPGFPDPKITQPNIRFQQTKKMADEMTRTDGMPLKYLKQEDGNYQPVVDQKKGKATLWSIGKLSSRENPLVLFTLSTQAAIGTFLSIFIGSQFGIESLNSLTQSVMYIPLLMVVLGLTALGLLMSTVHLGKPHRFYRGFNNLRYSPVCREGLGICIFLTCVGLHMLCMLPENRVFQSLFGTDFIPSGSLLVAANAFAALAIPAGATGLYYMYRCYRIPARPFWDHSHTGFAFVGNSLVLGGVVIAIIGVALSYIEGLSFSNLFKMTALMLLAGSCLEGIGLIKHAKDMNCSPNEGAASHYIQCTSFGKSYNARNGFLLVNILLATILLFTSLHGVIHTVTWVLLVLSSVSVSVVGRALFYVLVVPTTMPGAFFWKNKDFEQHARDIGLADMPQVGVIPNAH